ncbi:MAG: hypothetical protein MI922_03930, partial [Bacteroidales bacterium]|nr:hypothetical protein [Bacteroidales bacterium]
FSINGRISLLSLIKSPSGNPRLVSRQLHFGSSRNFHDYSFSINTNYLVTKSMKAGLGYQHCYQHFKLPYPFKTLNNSFKIQFTYIF